MFFISMFASSGIAKHPFCKKNQQCCTSTQDMFKDTLLIIQKGNSNTRRSSNPRPLGYAVCGQPLCYQPYLVTDMNQVRSIWTLITESTEHHIRIRCICCKTLVPNVKWVYETSHLHAIIRPHHFNFDVSFSCMSA